MNLFWLRTVRMGPCGGLQPGSLNEQRWHCALWHWSPVSAFQRFKENITPTSSSRAKSTGRLHTIRRTLESKCRPAEPRRQNNTRVCPWYMNEEGTFDSKASGKYSSEASGGDHAGDPELPPSSTGDSRICGSVDRGNLFHYVKRML